MRKESVGNQQTESLPLWVLGIFLDKLFLPFIGMFLSDPDKRAGQFWGYKARNK